MKILYPGIQPIMDKKCNTIFIKKKKQTAHKSIHTVMFFKGQLYFSNWPRVNIIHIRILADLFSEINELILNHYFISYTKINAKCIKDLNILKKNYYKLLKYRGKSL